MEWFNENKDWLLSGIAVTIPVAIIGWFLAKKTFSQKQSGGKGSTNIQIGRDVNVKKTTRDNNE